VTATGRSIARARQAWGSRTRTPAGGQGGYALAVVLGVIAMTSVVIVALLGLALTTAKVSTAQSRAAREMRAADGALEGVLATMATPGRPEGCAAVPAGTTVSFDDGTAETGDDTSVTVQCAAATTGFDPAQPLGGPDVKLVGGSAYTGSVAVPAVGADRPTLVATGTEALQFDADVSVRRGAALARSGGPPAVATTGQYVQGQAGPGASGTDCGPLRPGGPDPAQVVQDRNDEPTCGDATVAALSVDAQQLVSPGDTASAPARTLSTTACNGVPTGGVVTLQPGRYDAVQTSRLNQWLAAGACPGRTFWFRPSSEPGVLSVFAFDANPNRAGGAALVIAEPTISVVVGAPNGWNPATGGAPAGAFPQACDPAAAGASIQLSGRTALRHLAGRVAICPARNGATRLPAIVQAPTTSPDPITTAAGSTDFRLPNGADGGPALLASPNDANTSAITSFPCPPWVLPGFECPSVARSFTASFANVPPGPLRSAKVTVVTREAPPAQAQDFPRWAQIFVFRPNGTQLCVTNLMRAGRTHWQQSAYDLVADPGCRTQLLDQPGSVLEDASVRVSFYFAPTAPAAPTLSVRGVRLIVNDLRAEAAAVSGTGWTDPGNARLNDTAVTRFPQEACPLFGMPCVLAVPMQPRELSLTGLRFPDGTDDGQLSTLRVLVRNRPPPPSDAGLLWVSDPNDESSTEFRLTLADGRSCTVTYTGYSHSNQETQFDLLAGGGCAGVVTRLSDLNGSSLRIRLVTGCAWWGGTRLTPGADGRCGTVAMPEFQYAALTATTTTATARPPTSVVTVDARPTGGGSVFHVFGDTVVPRSDIDLRWQGLRPQIPLFNGSLVAHGLGSQMSAGAQMGVVCCSSPTRAVRLRASVDGQPRAEAVVQIDPPPAPGQRRRLVVQDWQLCGIGNCGAIAPVIVAGRGG
jgi:hypothetical protein